MYTALSLTHVSYRDLKHVHSIEIHLLLLLYSPEQAKEGALDDFIQTPILPSILDGGVIFLLRWACDDSVDAVVAAAVSALCALLCNPADEVSILESCQESGCLSLLWCCRLLSSASHAFYAFCDIPFVSPMCEWVFTCAGMVCKELIQILWLYNS